MTSKSFSKAALFFVLAAVFSLPFIYRFGYLKYHESKRGELKYTLESAMLFRYLDIFVKDGVIPEIDRMIEYPRGVNVRQTFSIMKEYIEAPVFNMCRRMGCAAGLETFSRIFDIAWFCLGYVWIFLLLRLFTADLTLSFLGTIACAVSIPAVARSYGIEYSGENFALPLLSLHFALFLAVCRSWNYIYALGAAVFLCAALMGWDMVQVYIGAQAAACLLVMLFRRRFDAAVVRNYFHAIAIQVFALYVCASMDPYLNSHAFYASPFLAMLACACIVYIGSGQGVPASRMFIYVIVPFAGIILFSWLWIEGYSGSYGHFFELLWYKLKFLNIRPADPSLLPMQVRLLWTPALHTPPVGSIFDMPRYFLYAFSSFGGSSYMGSWLNFYIIPAVLLAFCLLIGDKRRDAGAQSTDLTFAIVVSGFYAALFSICFMFFFRFHVLFSPFLWITLVLAAAKKARAVNRARKWFVIIMAFVCVLEAAKTSSQAGYWGRYGSFEEDTKVINWLGKETPGNAGVLANFGLSAEIVQYARRAVILHPKFETARMRSNVMRYAAALFSTDEKAFWKYCLDNKAGYYVYSRGTSSDTSPYSWRYITNTIKLSECDNYLPFKFAVNSYDLDYFWPLYDNGKYVVYKVTTFDEIKEAKLLTARAEEDIAAGRVKDAARALQKAVACYPGYELAHFKLAQLYNKEGLGTLAIIETKRGLKNTKVKRLSAE